MEKKLSTGKKVVLKEMSVDEMDDAKDLLRFGKEKDGKSAVYGIHKYNTAWIRGGLAGGDFKDQINGSVPDSVLKELSETEKVELANLIQEHNNLGE